jgi:hypothetical protein
MATVIGRTDSGAHGYRRLCVATPDFLTKIGVLPHFVASFGALESSELEGRLKRSKAIRHQGVPDPLAPPVTNDEPGISKHLQVMTHRRLSLAERFDEVAHANLAPFGGGEDRNDPEPGGISQGGEACRQFDRTGFIERCRKDRRTTLVDSGVEQSASPCHPSHFPIDIGGCIDHYKRIDGYECKWMMDHAIEADETCC